MEIALEPIEVQGLFPNALDIEFFIVVNVVLASKARGDRYIQMGRDPRSKARGLGAPTRSAQHHQRFFDVLSME